MGITHEDISPCIKCGHQPVLIHSHWFAYYICPNCGNYDEENIYYSDELSKAEIRTYLMCEVEPFFHKIDKDSLICSWNWFNTPKEEKESIIDSFFEEDTRYDDD